MAIALILLLALSAAPSAYLTEPASTFLNFTTAPNLTETSLGTEVPETATGPTNGQDKAEVTVAPPSPAGKGQTPTPPKSSCPMCKCPGVTNLICGTDGVVYKNDCAFGCRKLCYPELDRQSLTKCY